MKFIIEFNLSCNYFTIRYVFYFGNAWLHPTSLCLYVSVSLPLCLLLSLYLPLSLALYNQVAQACLSGLVGLYVLPSPAECYFCHSQSEIHPTTTMWDQLCQMSLEMKTRQYLKHAHCHQKSGQREDSVTRRREGRWWLWWWGGGGRGDPPPVKNKHIF